MVIIPVRTETDVFKARRAGREMAREMGFHSRDYSSIEIAISELATNIIRHASEGTIRLETIEDGLEIIIQDKGSGIEDVDAVLRETKKSNKGLGVGLRGVQRLMDQFEVLSEKGVGLTITVRKWKQKPPGLIRPKLNPHVPRGGLLKYGVVSTPYYGLEFNGDAYVVMEFDNTALIALIDGLGHGEAAYLPAQKAAEYVRKNHKSDFNAILRGCHKELRGPRGVVMGLVALDLKKSKFVCAGIGNIMIRVIGRQPFRFISNAGILGHNICITPHVTEFPYSRGDTLILNTDGISKRFEPEQLDIAELAPQEIAEIAVREYGKDSDDATIVVAREL